MEAVLSAVIGAGIFVFLAFLAPRDLHWLDAPEITAAAFGLGHAHPPGHPLVMMLLKGFLLLPLGDVPFRANLFPALFAAISSALVFRIGAMIIAAVLPPGGSSAGRIAGGLLAALLFTMTPSFWIQAISIEVYTLNSALVLGALYLAIRSPGDTRSGALIAVLIGMGLANHHLLTLLACPAVAVAWLRVRPPKGAIPYGLLVMIPVVAGNYAYLWVRGLAGGWPAWADTSGLDGVIWVASARIFAGSVGGFQEPLSGIMGNLGKASWLLAQNVSIVGLVAALGGFYFLLRRAGLLAALVTLLWLGLGAASKVGMGILDPGNPDDHGYFLPVVAGISVLISVFAVFLWDFAIRSRGLSGIVGIILSVSIVAVCLGSAAANGFRTAETRMDVSAGRGLSMSILDGMPGNSVFLAFHYPVFFRIQYEQMVEGARPDIALVHQSFYSKARGGAFYARRIAREHPDLQGIAQAFVQHGRLDWDRLRSLAGRRPVLMEPSLDVEVPGSEVVFAGWTFAVVPYSWNDTTDAPGVPTAAGHLQALRLALPAWIDVDLETRRILILHLASAGTWLGRSGHVDDARTLLLAALELNPLDRWLGEMIAGYDPG